MNDNNVSSMYTTTPTANLSIDVMAEDTDSYREYRRVANIAFYSIFIPIGVIGNTLSAIVVSYIVRHQNDKRCIPDILLGFLAFVDLFSILCVHSLSIVALIKGEWVFPKEVCVYQSFAVTTYLKLEFLVQVTISLDRYLALVKPLRYHSIGSLKTIKIAIFLVLLISTAISAITVGALPSSVFQLKTWHLCIYNWHTGFVPHIILLVISCTLFVIGICMFIYCNITLVRILWTYQAQRAHSFLIKEITDAVNVMEKKDLPSIRKKSSSSKSEKGQDGKRPSSTPSIRIRTPANLSQVSNCISTPALLSNSQDKSQSHSIKSAGRFTKLSASNVHDNSDQEDSATDSHEHDDSLVVTQTTHAGDSPKMKDKENMVENLQVIVNIEEPTSSPEMAGTPDSECHLINGHSDRSLNEINRPCTLQIPGMEAKLTVNHNQHKLSNGSLKSGSEGNTVIDNNSSNMLHTPECTSGGTKKRVSINLTLTPERFDESLGFRDMEVSRVLTPITIPLPNLTGARPNNGIGSEVGDQQINNFQTYARKLLKKVEKKAERQRREIILAQLVILCATIFIATWMPFIVSICNMCIFTCNWVNFKLNIIYSIKYHLFRQVVSIYSNYK